MGDFNKILQHLDQEVESLKHRLKLLEGVIGDLVDLMDRRAIQAEIDAKRLMGTFRGEQ